MLKRSKKDEDKGKRPKSMMTRAAEAESSNSQQPEDGHGQDGQEKLPDEPTDPDQGSQSPEQQFDIPP
jgi:hypothetical protein